MESYDIAWSTPLIKIIRLVDFTQEDLTILKEIYASTRQKELELTDWNLTQKNSFIQHQFTAQHLYYQQVYPSAFYSLVLVNNEIAGRLYLNDKASDLRIVDISLLPAFRNLSYGTQIITDLKNYCTGHHKSLSIHVEQFNPAKNLYMRLGFKEAETYDEVYVLMKWEPMNNHYNE